MAFYRFIKIVFFNFALDLILAEKTFLIV